MVTWAARRVLAVVPVLFGVSLAVFSMLFLVPGDPVKMMLAEFVTTPDQVAQMRAQLHLDDPILLQYGRFVGNALRGDLGTSIRSRRPVATEIGENLGRTAQLALASMVVAVAVGVPLGLVAALFRNSWLDVAAMLIALLGVSMPSFWLGLLLIFTFSLHLAWFPATGGGTLLHLVLPSVTLGAIASAIIARLTRSSMLEVLGQDYVRTARAKGLGWWGGRGATRAQERAHPGHHDLRPAVRQPAGGCRDRRDGVQPPRPRPPHRRRASSPRTFRSCRARCCSWRRSTC